MTQTLKPWTANCRGTLLIAAEMLARCGIHDLRVAVYVIDFAISECLFEFLNVLNLHAPKRRFNHGDLLKAATNFPSLVSLFKSVAPKNINKDTITQIEWYHQGRTNLKGNYGSICVNPERALEYFRLAELLFETLFGEPLFLPKPTTRHIANPDPGVHPQFPERRRVAETRLLESQLDEVFWLLEAQVVAVAQGEGFRGSKFTEAVLFLEQKRIIPAEGTSTLAEAYSSRDLHRRGIAGCPSSHEVAATVALALKFFRLPQYSSHAGRHVA